MYPGDPNGPGHEIYNCRCTMIAVLQGVDYSDSGRVTYKEWVRAKNED